MRDPRTAVAFDWDEGNEEKLAQRDIYADQIERLFENRPVFRRNKKGRAGVWMMLGKDPVTGRALRVAVCWKDEAAGILRAVTAFDL